MKMDNNNQCTAFLNSLKTYSVADLRNTYKLIDKELVYRRDQIFDKIKPQLESILYTIQSHGYKLQIIDYNDEDCVPVEVRHVMQFDVYDPVIETSEI